MSTEDTVRVAAAGGLPASLRVLLVEDDEMVAFSLAALLRQKGHRVDVAHTGQDAYNSDSFICVPLIYNNRLCGVMNLSNKKNGEPFEDYDLDRAQIAGSLMAVALADLDNARRAAAWS